MTTRNAHLGENPKDGDHDKRQMAVNRRWFSFHVTLSRPFLWLLLPTLVGVGLIVAGNTPFEPVRRHLDAHAGDGAADPYTPALHQRICLSCRVTGTLVILASWAAFVALRRPRSVAQAQDCPSLRARIAADAHLLLSDVRTRLLEYRNPLIALTFAAALLRLPWLNQPLRFDEAYTWLNYASRPWYILLCLYDAPNNHVFHSLIVHVVTMVGGDAAWTIRLPAFIAGVLLVPATFLLASSVCDRLSGWVAGVFVSVSSPLMEYSTNARGYTMMCLITVVGALTAVRLSRRISVLDCLLLAVCSAVGFWTIPVMLLPFSMIIAWLGLEWFRGPDFSVSIRQRILCLLLIPCVTAALTLGLYLPVLIVSGWEQLLLNWDVRSLSWSDFTSRLADSGRQTHALLLRDMPAAVQLILGCGVIVACVIPSARRLPLRCLLASAMAGLTVVVARRNVPPERVWLFVLPILLSLSAIGLVHGLQVFRSRIARAVVLSVLTGACTIWPVIQMIACDSILASTETGAFPDAERTVIALKSIVQQDESVVAVAPTSAPLVYYAQQQGLSGSHFDPPEILPDTPRSLIVVVSRTAPQTAADVLRQHGLEGALAAGKSTVVAEFPSATVHRIKRND